MLPEPTIYYLSEQAVTVQFGSEISEEVWNRVHTFNALLKACPFAGFHTAVPAYATLSLFYNPIQVMQAPDLVGDTSFDKVAHYLQQLGRKPQLKVTEDSLQVTIPVCYGGEFGPDLEELAQLHRLTIQEVIHLHCSAVYKVYMIGFVPGFAYLGGLHQQLNTPRKPTPRKAVPAGTVGIAGGQTGIYPLQTPGGWQLIGRTPLRLFNPGLPQPALLQAGNHVVFTPISESEFQHYHHQHNADTH